MRGSYAPVLDEVEAFDLPVQGRIPAELNGRYVRNGANPKHGVTMHWFAGDGMLHGVRLRDGKAEWYRNRWVRTKALAGVDRRDTSTGTVDLTVGSRQHARRAPRRAHLRPRGRQPSRTRSSPELDTLGPCDFGGALRTPFTAHPHTCPETGEMHFFGYELVQRAVRHLPRASTATARSCTRSPSRWAGPTMVHDFAISRNYAIFLDLPVVFDLDLAISGTMPFQWQRVVRRAHRAAASRPRPPRRGSRRWFDVPLCYVFHIMNAWDDGPDGRYVWLDAGRARQHVGRRPRQVRAAASCTAGGSICAPARCTRNSSTTSRTRSRASTTAAPGLPNRFGWAVAPRDPAATTVAHGGGQRHREVRPATAARTVHDFGPTRLTRRAGVRAGARRGRRGRGLSRHVRARTRPPTRRASWCSTRPTCRRRRSPSVPLPQRVPLGFHGSWFAD